MLSPRGKLFRLFAISGPVLHFVAEGALFNVVHIVLSTLKLVVAIFHALGAVFHGVGIIVRTTVQSLLHEGVNSPGRI